ncbi:MAG: hypothetical protein D6B26_06495, partial [Spirochaetaceae bacterium]
MINNSRAIRIFTTLLFGFICLPAFADFNPAAGGDELDRFLSPRMLNVGDFGLINEYPSSGVINPAAPAAEQRVHLDASYINVSDFANKISNAHVINLGGIYPSPAGVAGANLQFLHSRQQSFNVGTMLRLLTSFSKEVYDTIDVGAGIDFAIGYGDQLDWSLTGKLGIIHSLENTIDIPGARYGIAITGLGKWFQGNTIFGPYPSPFTPVLEFGFSPVITEKIQWDVFTKLSFPSFQNVRTAVGTELIIARFLRVGGGINLDLKSILNNPSSAGNYLPSIGLDVQFSTDIDTEKSAVASQQGWTKSDIRVRAGAAPLPLDTWAIGAGVNAALGVVDTEAPIIDIASFDSSYISPNNDGKKDTAIIPISITDQRYISGYKLILTDQQEEIVRTIVNVDPRPESRGVKNFIDRLLRVKTGIPVPEQLIWDGRGDNGKIVEDGQYHFHVVAWDDNENTGETEKYSVIVDNTPPSITLVPPTGDDLIFSPQEGSFQTEVRIQQTGSNEKKWTGEILNSSRIAVKTYSWNDSEPNSFAWNGTNDDQQVVADGVYSYRISSKDNAGNEISQEFFNIIVNTEPTPVFATVSDSFLSPGNDGAKDNIVITADIGNRRGLKSWELEIKNSRNLTVRKFSGDGLPPIDGIEFDGANDNGEILPEGKYNAELVVFYQNGNRPTASTPFFEIDTTRPSSSISVEHQIFSPNNSGIRDEQIIYQETSNEQIWTGVIKNADGLAVREFIWEDEVPSQLVWRGKTSTGELAADGMYSYQLFSTDRAGNLGNSNMVFFELNTEETPVIVTSSLDAFSPDGKGNKNTISIIPNLRKTDDIEYFQFEIIDSENRIVRSIQGSGELTQAYIWDGL